VPAKAKRDNSNNITWRMQEL